MSGISQPFDIVHLPKSSALDCAYTLGNTVYCAISRSSIACYQILPVVKLRWSYAVSLSSSITALHVLNDFCIFYGVTDRKKHYFKYVELDPENGQTKHESALPLKSPLLSIAATSIYDADGICENGSVMHLSRSEDEQSEWSIASQSKPISETLKYCRFIDDDQHVALLITSKTKTSDVLYLVAPSGQEILQKQTLPFTSSAFAYTAGMLYHAPVESDTVSVYDIYKKASSELLKLANKISLVSIFAVDDNRLIVHQDNGSVSLLDIKFKSNLGSADLSTYSGGCKILDVSDNFVLASTSTSLLGVNILSKASSLLDSIGRGVAAQGDDWILGMINLDQLSLAAENQADDSNVTKHVSKQLKAKISTHKKEQEQLLDNLVAHLKAGQIEDFDKLFLGYAKKKYKGGATVYEEDDRQLEHDLVLALIKHLFIQNSEKKLILNQHVPENSILYLLTHPLLPNIKGLLHALLDEPTLYRQAIVTAPSLKAADVVSAFFHTDDEIFRDAVNRLSEEFSESVITKAFRQLPDKLTTLTNILTRLIRLDIGWQIMNCIIDAGGLFAWGDELSSGLSSTVSEKISIMENAFETASLIDELLRRTTGETKRELIQGVRKSKNKKTNPGVIVETTPVESVIAFGTPNTKEPEALAKRAAVYSIEKLVF